MIQRVLAMKSGSHIVRLKATKFGMITRLGKRKVLLFSSLTTLQPQVKQPASMVLKFLGPPCTLAAF